METLIERCCGLDVHQAVVVTCLTRSDCRNRILKLLESANIKLASVATDVFGVSGMAMLQAIVAGQMTPAEIADLAKGRLRKKLAALELGLQSLPLRRQGAASPTTTV